MKITGKAIAVFAKKNGKLTFFKIYKYPYEEGIAREKFVELMKDNDEYRLMTIEHLSKVLEVGCEELD